MRFLPRSAEPVEPLDAVRDAHHELPLKAQDVLGANERRRPKSKRRQPPETYLPTGSPPRREDQTSPSPMLPPLNPTEPLSFESVYARPNPLKLNPPSGNGRMSPFPNMQAPPKFPPQTTSANDLRSQPIAYAGPARQPQRGPPSVASSSAVQPHQFYPDSKPSIDSFESKMRDYYDASTQPLYVSQQTSASAVRDHGLRKGSPVIAIPETSSDPTLTKLQKPLKSAMKKSAQESGRKRDGERKGRRLDLGSLFAPQPKSTSAGGNSPSALARAERNFDFFPEETVHAKLQRPKPHARFETQKSTGTLSNHSDKTVREKVFEKDIYDNTKMHVRRPPKGIKNWFDGFDISSDEEEKMCAREEHSVKKDPPPAELPATEALQTNCQLPSTFSPYDGALDPRQRQQRPQRPAHTRKASMDPVEDNLLAIEHAKEMMKRRAPGKPNQTPDRSPASTKLSANTKQHRESESRLAHSRLGSQSVLSLSSESGDDDVAQEASSRRDSIGDESVILGNAASVGMHRPNAPPRQLHSAPTQPEEQIRRSISTSKTSGSIPMRLGSDVVPVPPIPADHSTLGSPRAVDTPAQALRRLNGMRDSTSQPSRSRRTTRSGLDDSQSMADRSTAEETTSSATDGSRMMQVSEEEMILLELMRQKRAAMQKDSFSEGYRLALKQEQEHLAKRREGAHRTALQLLKAKEDMSKRQSVTSTVFSEDHENPAVAALRRKYSALHKEDVDKALKLERFLALDPHGQVQVVPGADRFPAPPIVVDGEDDETDEEPPALLQARTYSPMQKLTEKVRNGGSRSASQTHSTALSRSTDQTPPDALSDEYLEDHHEKVHAFLASSSASEAQEFFPTPPSHSRASTRQDDWHRKRGSMMSPSPVPEEEPVIDDTDEYSGSPPTAAHPTPLQPRLSEPPARHPSPNHAARAHRAKYRLSYTPDSDPLLETIGGLAPPHPPHQTHKLHDPYPDITPILDAGPLELPTAGAFPGSPSLSSRPSPVTPTFPAAPATHSGRLSHSFVEIAGSATSDTASFRGGGPPSSDMRAYTPDTEVSPSTPALLPGSAGAKKSARRSAAMDAHVSTPAGKRGARESVVMGMGSATSAGEDVLAAWAELGGGSADFAFRKAGRP